MKISVDEVRAVIALHGASVMAGIQHLSNYLEGMDYSKVFELEVLMDFGREWYEGAANGEQGAEISLLDCYHAYEKCAENPDGKANAINYLVGKSLLAEYLRAAMAHCDPARVQLPHQKEQACMHQVSAESDDQSEPSVQAERLMQHIRRKLHPRQLSDGAYSLINELLQQFPYELLIECIDISATQYLKRDDKGTPTRESAIDFLDKIGGIAHNKSASPIDQAISHLMNTAKKNFAYFNDRTARIIFQDYVKALRASGWDDMRIHDDLAGECMEVIRNARNWSQWRETMERWTDELYKRQGQI